jgi:peroxiredoxin Q/BCP
MAELKVKIGDKVPDFELPNQDGRNVRLSSYLGSPVVLFIYPEADTPG